MVGDLPAKSIGAILMDKITCLSIQQPWAWLIAHGYKDIENRTWATKFRGAFFIHAGQKIDWGSYNLIDPGLRREGINMPSLKELEDMCGGIVGYTTLVDCVIHHDSPWFFGEYGFVLKNSAPIDLVPLKGKLGFFKAPTELNYLRQMTVDLRSAE